MIEKLIQQIDEKQDDILSNLDSESITIYSFLKTEYLKGNIQENLVFQFVFRKFYGLDNAGLSEMIKIHFFKLLAEKQTNLEIILSDLYEIPRKKGDKSMQFSFATKLLHTIDDCKPIYDTEIGSLTYPRPKHSDKDTMIQSYLELYNKLEQLNAELLENDKIKRVISKFRSQFHVDTEKMSDVKALDFIMWSLGKLKEKHF
jgi:hypothetical protein